MTFRKILVPTDFSTHSKEATRVAIQIANEEGADLVIAHAWYIPALAYGIEPVGFSPELLQRMSDDAARALDEALQEAKKAGAKGVTETLLTGVPPWARIVEMLEADPAFDLVVMGTHGRTGLKRVLLGSVATNVVRHAPCSVLVVRPDAEPGPFTDILCPIDFSDSSQLVVDLASQLVRPGGSGITLLHVIEAPVSYTGEAYATEFLRGLDKAGARALDDVATRLRARVQVPVITRTRVGYAGAETLAVLDDDPTFDLVVMGSHGRTGIRRALLGSVAEKVVRHAPCPVLIARQRA